MSDKNPGPTKFRVTGTSRRRTTHGSAWRPRLRWLAAELAVVVLGVLAALGVQSWYQSRSDRAKERAYVRQLQSELGTSVDELQRALQIQRESERAAVQLQRAVLMRVRPPEDSLATWAIDLNYYSDPSASLGTARALLTTGDILLIRDPDIRAVVVDIVERTAYAESQLRIWQPYFLDAIDRLDGILSNTDLIAQRGFTVRLDSLTASRDWLPEPSERRSIAALSVSRIMDNPAFRHVLRSVRLASANLRSIQEAQLEALRAAQQVVNRAAQ